MKKAKHNTNSLEQSSKHHENPTKFIGNYKDLRDFKMKPATEGFIDRLALLLMKWSEVDENDYKLNQFFRMQGLAPEQFYDWVLKYPNLKDAHQYAKRCIGDRREINALNRKISETVMLKRQHAYDPEWEEDRQRDKQDKIDVSKAVNDSIERPTQIILGQLPGLEEYPKVSIQSDKELL